MARTRDDHKGRAGFALIVVLFTLVVLTALFALAQSRSVAHLQQSGAERLLLSRGLEARDLLELAIGWRLTPEAAGRTSFRLTYRGADVDVVLQDTGGLVDLNSASPALLGAFADALLLDRAALERYRDWRRTPLRLLRLSDFDRVAGIIGLPRLEDIATVYSGRQGIAPEVAPASLVALLGHGSTSLPPELVSAPSGTNYLVRVDGIPGAPRRILGTIHIGPDRRQSRVLAVLP